MQRAIKIVAEAITLYETGRCRQPHKVVLRGEDNAASEKQGRINGLFALIRRDVRVMGTKWVASFPGNPARGLPRASAVIILNSPDTGLPLTVMDGTLISAMRTGAVTALGAQYLAPVATRTIGVIGAGVQARTQILGLATALPQVKEIRVNDCFPERAEALAEECQKRWRMAVTPVRSIAETLEGADVALTVTTAEEPVMRAEYVKPGALTIQIAGHDCEFEVVSQCQKIVADSWDGIKHRGVATPALMYAQGLLRDQDIYADLGQLILGLKSARESDDERIHFVHNGMGVEDIALAWDVYCDARNLNLGQRLKLWERPLWV